MLQWMTFEIPTIDKSQNNIKASIDIDSEDDADHEKTTERPIQVQLSERK